MNELTKATYLEWIRALSSRYRKSQIKAAIAVNVEMLKFYWSLGADIVHMEASQPWGSKFLQRLSEDLQREMPEAKCFSVTNLDYMRRFFKLFAHIEIAPQVGGQLEDTSTAITPQVGGQLEQLAAERYYEDFPTRFPNVLKMILSVPWGHHKIIMDKFRNDQRTALFYVSHTVENGWSRSMLEHWIATNLHRREGRAVSNFNAVPEIAADSDLANEMLEKFLPPDFVSDLPTVEAIEADQTRRLQLLLGEKAL